jgi:nucleoside-diphosphate-sugar epimerase
MILVLGSQGFVGSAICRYLERIGEPFIGIDLHNYAEHVGKSCSFFINANGNSSKRLAESEPRVDFARNVEATLCVLGDFDIGCYLHISSIDVYNDTTHPERSSEDAAVDYRALSPYGFHKWLAERIVERYARKYVIFRLGGMIGANMRKGPAFDILNEQPLWVSPESEFLFLDTALVAEYVWHLRHQFGEIFNVVASAPLSLRKFADIAGRRIGEVKSEVRARYHVNNERARSFFSIPASEECVHRVLARGIS